LAQVAGRESKGQLQRLAERRSNQKNRGAPESIGSVGGNIT
jgi:hypothetical protein